MFQQLSKRGLLGGWANRLAVPEPLGCLAYGFLIGVRERGSGGLSHTRYLLMQSVRGIGHWVDYWLFRIQGVVGVGASVAG